MNNYARRTFLKTTGLGALAQGLLSSVDVYSQSSSGGENPAPSLAQLNWMKLAYGMFFHFGPNTIAGEAWGDGKFPAADFKISRLDTDQWARIAVEAGMKYAVLTVKHHDGFCLWPSAYTEYSVRNSPSRIDIVGAFVNSCRKAGLKTGFYYSLWDRNFPKYEEDGAYAEYLRNQIGELLTHYGQATQLWFDGAWDKDFPTRKWQYNVDWEKDKRSGLLHGERWEWEKLYSHIHQLQPGCLVQNNSSSDRPGGVRYFPVDARTAEHFDFIMNEKIVDPIISPEFTRPDGKKVFLPLEFAASLSPSWFWTGEEFLLHASAETIAGWYRTARAQQANFLLNVGPNASKRIGSGVSCRLP